MLRQDGLPASGEVLFRWNPDSATYPEDMIGDVLESARLEDGRFTFLNVWPGEYLLETAWPDGNVPPDGSAKLAITVAGEDLVDLVLTTVPEKRQADR